MDTWQHKWRLTKNFKGADLIVNVMKWQNLALLIDISEHYSLSPEEHHTFIQDFWKIENYHPEWTKSRHEMLSQWKHT